MEKPKYIQIKSLKFHQYKVIASFMERNKINTKVVVFLSLNAIIKVSKLPTVPKIASSTSYIPKISDKILMVSVVENVSSYIV